MLDLLSNSWESTTPGKPRMCTGSPTWTLRESARWSTGKASPATFRRARSRADISLSGGLYFFTSAFSRPLAVTTKIWGWRLTLAVGSTVSSACAWPPPRGPENPPAATHPLEHLGQAAVVTAAGRWFAIQGAAHGRLDDVASGDQPAVGVQEPAGAGLPKTGGVTFCGRIRIQLDLEATSATTSTTAGLARWMASWTVMASGRKREGNEAWP